MTPRIRAILRADHMAGVAQLLRIADVSAQELESLEPFVLFCAQHRVAVPGAPDIRAFLSLTIPPKPTDSAAAESWRTGTLHRIDTLVRTLQKLEFDPTLIEAAGAVRDEIRHRLSYRGHNHGCRRDYRRTVSVRVEDLPGSWQLTLRRLRRDQTYCLSILDRMERRLGMLAWSAEKADLPIDLENPEAECALYDDLIDRSRNKAINNGEDPADAQPRWAYLRSTAEELKRFATHHGVSMATRERFDRNYRGFAGLENRQTPLKMFAALQAPQVPVTLAQARIQLKEAGETSHPLHRHHRRLKACARGITVACPPRARDVVDRMLWGAGIHYRPHTRTYAFAYSQSKTDGPLKIDFEPHFNMFFDALLLGDNDPRYLPQIRDQAIAQRRPLFVRYDGEPVAYGWIGRTWDEAIGSSSHLARTLLQTFLADLGEPGVDYGRRANGHRARRIVERYRDDRARQVAAGAASDAFAARGGKFDDDIEDLL